MTGYVFVYTTFPNKAAAQTVGEYLVNARLAACVNIYPGMQSIYQWKGQIERNDEVGMFVKTRRELADAVMTETRARHPYEVPALLVLPIEKGNADYFAWLENNTRQES